MDGRKAKIKILKSKNNRNLKDDVLEANIKYIGSTSDHTSSITTNNKTTKKRKTTAEIVTEVINKTVPVMVTEVINKTVPVMITEVINKTVPVMITEAINKTVPVMISSAINNALKPIEATLKTVVAIQEEQGRELKSLRADFNTIVRVNNLKTK
ncbi:MAG: hypothetical protein LBG49_02015 [Mycoplasmataceae bacterium]|jgi:hypothetical protein|nr:hypothetical protein [Mycoplasmataceae bacterium]